MRVRGIALGVSLVMGLAACGGGGAETDADGVVTVKVGVMSMAEVAPIYMAMEKGFFAKEKLKITPQVMQGGAQIVPAVVSGDLQFGYSNNTSLLVANAKGLPVRVVANANNEADDAAKAGNVLVAKKGGPVRSPADLAGKKIAINTLGNISEITVRAALEARGVPLNGVKFVELAYPDMLPALDAGRVDAANIVEPFSQTAKANGDTVVIRPFHAVKPGLSIASYFTSASYAGENKAVVDRFVRAVAQGQKYSTDHPDEMRAVVAEYTRTSPEVVNAMMLPEFGTEIDRAQLTMLGDLSKKYGLIDEKPDIGALVGSAK
ncbi:sulfonate ABC transporter substrate-binding protein [Actinomadura cremea]|nr:sulfonate ABC transporter substrate-binding protein [Actinomadura cremea]